jgi:hypothetical protein
MFFAGLVWQAKTARMQMIADVDLNIMPSQAYIGLRKFGSYVAFLAAVVVLIISIANFDSTIKRAKDDAARQRSLYYQFLISRYSNDEMIIVNDIG